MARTPTRKPTKRAESIGDPGLNAMPTARAMDSLFKLMLLSGAGSAIARTGSELVDRVGRSRSSPFYKKQERPNLEARVQTLQLPYVKGARGPGDVYSEGPPRPRGRAARLGRNIDPAENMRVLGAKPLPADPALAAEQRAKVIAANLAKTRANRARPGYRKSYAHTNVNPLGQAASNVPPKPATVVASGAKPAAAPAAGAQPLGPAFGGARPAPMLSSRIPAPSRAPAPRPLGLAPAGAPSPRPLGLAPPGGLFSAPAIPPRAPAPAPRTAMFGYSPMAASKAASAEPGDASAWSQQLVKALGLTGDSSLRRLVNPTDATSLAGMPWWLAAAPAAVLVGSRLGYKPVDMAFQGLRKGEDKAELDEAKERYNTALRAQALSKTAADKLDAAYEAVKAAGLLEAPMGILALIAGGSGTAGLYHGWNKERKVNSAAVLDAALKQRRAELLARMPRAYAVRPEAVTPGQQRKALRSIGAAPDVDEDL